ncbi:MAG: hypothetical protein DSZ28_00395 [Thiothrix sp.]|nr:MAG: hypothetical protein DSZ28_00395 [Thiothrix sp.]
MKQNVYHPALLGKVPLVKRITGCAYEIIYCKKRCTNALLLSAILLVIAGCAPEIEADRLKSKSDSYLPDRILKGKEAVESQANDPRSTATCEITEQQQHMLALVNQARAEARSCGDDNYVAVAPLTWNCQLRDAAIAHTKDMTTNNFFDHSGSDGLRAGDRITAAGYNWRYYGENLAAGYVRSEDALAGLLDSPGHCKNIMNVNVTEFGSYMEFVNNLDFQSYWTHVFGKPM